MCCRVSEAPTREGDHDGTGGCSDIVVAFLPASDKSTIGELAFLPEFSLQKDLKKLCDSSLVECSHLHHSAVPYIVMGKSISHQVREARTVRLVKQLRDPSCSE
eukprot:1802633-Amphidinium_carterae.1